jgi:hypothetical protein
MRLHHIRLFVIAALIAIAAIASVASVAEGNSRDAGFPPTLYTGGLGGKFVVRPGTILTMAGVTVLQSFGQMPNKGGRIQWRSWTNSVARGKGTLWTNDCTPTTADGTWHGRRTSVTVTRVRNGRFTRMTLRYRGSEISDESGGRLHVVRYRLERASDSEGGVHHYWTTL